jgi:hypothetical protein
MWKIMLVLLLLAAHLNLTALVPLQPGDPQPPWWVGGRLVWPFAVETTTLLKGDVLNILTPILGIASATVFLLAAAALLRWLIPSQGFRWLIFVGAALSIVLQLIWFTGWAILPILIDAILLWFVFGQGITVDSLRELTART